MNKLWMIGSVFLAVLSATPSTLAQSAEIIVTGEQLSRYSEKFVPVVHLNRTADFMVMRTTIESDSRDLTLRRSEVLKTLDAMAARASRDQNIELGVLRIFETGDDQVEYIEPYLKSTFSEDTLTRGARADTTRTTIVVKTPIKKSGDSADAALARIETFIDGVPITGRAVVDGDSSPALSIVNIDQYRAPLLKILAEDNATVRGVFGDNYAVEITGLENPVQWRVIGPLDLAIYFPYKSAISPK